MTDWLDGLHFVVNLDRHLNSWLDSVAFKVRWALFRQPRWGPEVLPTPDDDGITIAADDLFPLAHVTRDSFLELPISDPDGPVIPAKTILFETDCGAECGAGLHVIHTWIGRSPDDQILTLAHMAERNSQ